MIEGFGKLNDTQFQKTKDAIAWITILIAGADGEIDKEEKEWAAKVTKIRGYQYPTSLLMKFYEEVGAEYSNKLEDLLANAPKDSKERTDFSSKEIEQLNDILPHLDGNLGHHLSKSYKSFAKHVAKASGGFLGFMSIGSEEHKLVDLPMLNAIELVDEDLA